MDRSRRLSPPGEKEKIPVDRVLWLVLALLVGILLFIYPAIKFSEPWMFFMTRVVTFLVGVVFLWVGIKGAFKPF